jgi:hypothetical protein
MSSNALEVEDAVDDALSDSPGRRRDVRQSLKLSVPSVSLSCGKAAKRSEISERACALLNLASADKAGPNIKDWLIRTPRLSRGRSHNSLKLKVFCR